MSILELNPHIEEFLIQRLPKIIQTAGWQLTYTRTPKSKSFIDLFGPSAPRIYRYKFKNPFGTIKCEMEPQAGFVELVMNGPGGSHEKRLNVRRYVKVDMRTKKPYLKNVKELTSQLHLLMFYHGPVANPQLLPVHIQKLLQYLQLKAQYMHPIIRDQTLTLLSQYVMGQLQLQPMNQQFQQLFQHLQLMLQQQRSGQLGGPPGTGAPGTPGHPGLPGMPGMTGPQGQGLMGGLQSPFGNQPTTPFGTPQTPYGTPTPPVASQPQPQPQQPTPSSPPSPSPSQPTQPTQPSPPSPGSEPAASAAPEPEPEPEPALPEECPACGTPIDGPMIEDPPRCPACGRLL